VIAFVVVVWAMQAHFELWSWPLFVSYLLLLFNGALLHYLVNIATVLPMFWTQSPDGYSQVAFTMQRVMERPDRIFSGPVRVIFTTVLPFGLMASFPARLILEDFHWPVLAHLVGVSAILWIAVILFWNRALRIYSSASS
jgi:ABC-2 type transport system permease protein